MSGLSDPVRFRRVLSAYPTGVCVVTAIDAEGQRHGMVVGSFTSISLDPPLVGFFPGKATRSWTGMRDVGRFTVNVLGAHQLELCRQLAAGGADKFDGVPLLLSPGGHPLIDGAIAWLECTTQAVHEIGDHYLVVGRVDNLEGDPDADPLLFFGGAYHRIGGRAALPENPT